MPLAAGGQEDLSTTATALPPDLRRWLCPAGELSIKDGAAPLVRGFALVTDTASSFSIG
ncbi:MAG: hypothetical protein ACREBC_05150 [Pyrinomonadaceae bacterium]